MGKNKKRRSGSDPVMRAEPDTSSIGEYYRRDKIKTETIRDAHKRADNADVKILVKRPERWPDKPAEK